MKRKGHTQPVRGTPEERFWPKVNKNTPTGCWEWQGALVGTGYGHFRIDSATRMLAHVFAYVSAKGRYQKGLQIDHLCKNTRCVRPDHLEPVTPRVNFMRSDNPVAIAVRTNRCKHGHDLALAYQQKIGPRGRKCRQCHKRISAKRYAFQRKLLAEARRQIAIWHGVTYLTPEGREDVLHHELRDAEVG